MSYRNSCWVLFMLALTPLLLSTQAVAQDCVVKVGRVRAG